MKVVFSNTIFFLQKKGGISRYFVNLNKELRKNKINSKIIAPINKNIYLKKSDSNNISFFIKRFPRNFFLYKLNNFLFSYFLKKENPDIIHETYYDKNNLNILKNKIKIVTVYDLIHEKFSKFYSKEKSLEKNKILKNVDHFVCISKKTQNDFINYYNIPAKKTSVIYLGCDHLKKYKKKNNFKLKDEYFLYVGDRNGYKNFAILCEAINKSKKLKNMKVICFGGGKFSNYEIKKYNLKSNFINYQGNDFLMSNLYKNARAYINTSKYEGFGIPNIEAMYLGCPVITSDFSVFKEIGGNSNLFFKNGDYKDLANKMIYFLDKKNRDIYIKRGIKNSKKFTWSKCAIQTKDLYESLVKTRNNHNNNLSSFSVFLKKKIN
jgi:glycosyltransferase involved in cell wall biosynthesis